MNIRPGTPADGEPIAALIQEFQPILTLDPTGRGAEKYLASVSPQAERQYLESPRYSYLVAERDGEILGFIAIRDKTHVFHMFVSARHQLQGIARDLWNRAREQALRESGAVEMTVNSSLKAYPVYERFGFVATGSEVHTHGIAFVPMKLKLQNAA
jgi:GNAT superfamily N-acetyltransferase